MKAKDQKNWVSPQFFAAKWKLQIPSPGMRQVFGAAGESELSVGLILPCLSASSVSVVTVSAVWETS